ncbi:gamma-glutamyltransferase family protein [Auraticoccus sp. F435]|uniref:Gamma-glutamyltransferase family protein n=1 Tax=Auraticoccus cholistanensis TaxID=2656650 RepID=A0A6A9V289_9ACTN|nr:gamma-glutamyltransferase [Auraticoccus cholistanensis]MVA77740.1 gamma-glutamyltransferase family protein [Auraticoccus cholistanensis]
MPMIRPASPLPILTALTARTARTALTAATAVAVLVSGCSGTGTAPASGTGGAPVPSPSSASPTTAGVEVALTVHPAATEAALDVLADGGSAADAAVAAAAVLSVVEPYFSNVIGGETSALHRDGETGRIQSLSGVGYVGEEYTVEDYRTRGETGYGLYQSLVPGAWGGWMLLLEEHGRLGLDRLLQPAVELAREGHPAGSDLAERLAISVEGGAVNAAAEEVYLPEGTPLREGETVVQRDFAETLTTLSESYTAAGDHDEGLRAARDALYEGPLAEQVVEAIQADGGYVTLADMARFEARLTEPLSLAWDEQVTVHQNPPPSQGLAMVAALNTLRTADLSGGPEDPAAVHLQVEAMKLAMADREAYVGDPDLTRAPLEQVLSEEYGTAQLARIDPDAALAWPITDGVEEMTNTTTFQVVDASGDAVAVTTSTGFQLTAAGETGIMLNNRMRFMTADDPGSPNHLQPGKRVRYTGNPWMATRGEELWLLGGVIGVDTQPQVQTQHFIAVAEFGMTPAEAVAAPRLVTEFHPDSVAPHEVPNVLQVEGSLPDDVVRSLRDKGQEVVVDAPGAVFGYGSVVELAPGRRGAELGEDPRVETSTGEVRGP